MTQTDEVKHEKENGSGNTTSNGKDPEPKVEVKTENDIKPDLKREMGDSDDESPADRKKIKPEARISRHCPYLDTIDRGVLDFDFEKLCSVSLSRINVYACLVCGKYFQVTT